ncbi:MAG: preprotein translocase subunit SecG [Alphaproteobacteria bacterium]
MENVILAIHLLVALVMILLILIQRPAQDGGGLMGSGGTMGGVFTARGGANALTKTTAVLATIFILTSLTLTFMASRHHGAASDGQTGLIQSIMKKEEPQASSDKAAPAATPQQQKPAETPSAPAVPMAQ